MFGLEGMMEQGVDAAIATVFNGLDALPLEREDRAKIMEIVMERLTAKRAVKPAEPPSLNKLARDIFRISHERNDALGPRACPAPEWNMLLELVIAHTDERPVDTSSLCTASGVPMSTALRRMDRMETLGLLKRRECTTDRRRIWVEPTTRALDATTAVLRRVYRAG